MNILLTSIGRRGLIVGYFKEALAKNGGGKVYTTDADVTAAAIHLSDGFFVVPRVTSGDYVDALLEICTRRQIAAVLSFVDPELEVLAANRSRFASIGTTVLVPDARVVEICYDKYKTYKFLARNNIPTPVSYNDVEQCLAAVESSRFSFPAIIKPARGSASQDVHKVDNAEELESFSKKVKDYVIQEYFHTPEYGVDVLADFDGEVVAVFAKRKLVMRAGETDKAVSVKEPKLLEIGVKLGELLGGPGPLDIDLFEKDGEFLVSEINPRFGGGYPSAYECGVDFMDRIVRMLQGEKVAKNIGDYEENVYSSKHSHIVVFRVDRPESRGRVRFRTPVVVTQAAAEIEASRAAVI